jgi:hypothetical protein
MVSCMAARYNERISIRLPSKLKGEVRDYVAHKHEKITTLIVRLLSELIEHDKKQKDAPDAEQI